MMLMLLASEPHLETHWGRPNSAAGDAISQCALSHRGCMMEEGMSEKH